MKIGIITHPLECNYGGLLQNYALQQVLRSLGHDAYTIDKVFFQYHRRWSVVLLLKRFIKRIIGREISISKKQYCFIKKNCTDFVKKNINVTKKFENDKELKSIIKKYKFDAYIVGSDQVWRPAFANNIYNDFLDFCQDKKNIKRLAYSASFGISEWEFSEEQTKECSRLAKLFDAISVREDSGIVLCKEHLDVDAMHVLDPTLLLEKEEYIKLVEKN